EPSRSVHAPQAITERRHHEREKREPWLGDFPIQRQLFAQRAHAGTSARRKTTSRRGDSRNTRVAVIARTTEVAKHEAPTTRWSTVIQTGRASQIVSAPRTS